ncbi:MAG: polysaccharide biosynthesis/export family protein [Terracidiphilus sp.]
MKLHASKSIVVAAFLLFSSNGLIAQDSPAPAPAEPGAVNAASPADPSAVHRAHDSTFIIGNDDVLAISVWKETELSRSVPVRSDGKISLPLIGEIQASGKTPLQLESEISDKLKSYITAPEVTVIVEQINSKKFNVMGMVSKPGTYPLALPLTIMDAVALAGGFRDFAKTKDVYILRQRPDGSEYRIPFNYKAFIKGKNPAQNVRIEPRDTIIVP